MIGIIKKLIAKLKGFLSGSKLDVMRLSGGTLGGQLISIIAIPFCTRLYGSGIIGDWTILQSTAAIVNSFSDLGLIRSVMIARDKDEAKKIFTIVTVCGNIFGLLCAGLYLGVYSYYNIISAAISPLFVAAFIYVAVLTLQQVELTYQWLNYNGDYKILMWNPLISNGVFSVLALVFGFAGFTQYGYFIAWLLGQVVTLLHMKRHTRHMLCKMSFKDVKVTLKEHKQFVKYQMPGTLTANIRAQIPVYLIRAFFGSEMVGFYSMTYKILSVPINLLSTAIGKVFFKNIADLKDNVTALKNYVYRNINRLLVIAGIPMFFIVIIGDVVLNFVLGKGWEAAGFMFRILALQNMFYFMYNTAYGLPIVIGKQRAWMFSNIIQIVFYVAMFAAGSYFFDNIYIAFALQTVMFIIINVAYLAYLFHCIGISGRKYAMRITAIFLGLITAAELIRAALYFLGLVPTL